MADYYIAQNNGTSSGPFKMDELLAKGLTGETLVWHQGMSQWKAASAMPELVALLASNEAPPLPYASGANNLLQQEIEKAKLEIEELRNKVEKIDQGDIEDLARKPLEFKEKTRYDFRCPTWTKETWMILACVACHFFLGVTKITTFSYIFLDLIGFALCFAALYIGSTINTLNKVSYTHGTPTREKADKLARTNGWLVSITALIGIVIILIQSGLDMFGESVETGITYSVIYIVLMGLAWYANFRPIKLDGYSLMASPTRAANTRIKSLQEDENRRWRRECRTLGIEDDSSSDDYDSDSSDSDWDFDSSDDDDGDWDWGGGDSGGGGASSDW